MFPDVPILKHSQGKVLGALNKGEITDLAFSCKMPVDNIVSYGLKEGLVQSGLKEFPDPRKRYEVPIEVLLLPQIIQRLNDEHSLLTAPYMLNSAELMAHLGYSAQILEEGFNERNIYPREAPFHGETLKHVLLATKVESIIDWYNEDWSPLMKGHARGEVRQYLMDGMKIHIPPHLYEKFEGAGIVKNNDGDLEYGYKVVWIYELIDRKGIIRGLKFAPIETHDLVLGKELVEEFDFPENSLLTMDRGFIDSEWISDLKQQRGIDICIPLRRNMLLSELARDNDVPEADWREHPTREGQRIRELSKDELEWEECPVFESGVLINIKKKTGEDDYIVLVDTRDGISPEKLLETYDLRSEIEECHRQLKCFQGLEKLPSKKLVQVVFRIIMGVIAYNLFTLFLNSEGCTSFKDYTLKLYRQKRRFKIERNPDIILYTDTDYAVVKGLDFLKTLVSIPKDAREKLQKLFDHFSQGPSP